MGEIKKSSNLWRFGQYSIDWNGLMAITTFAVLPLLIVFVFVQRYVISGITSGAVR